ncbi:MAG: beta-glucuronidase [Kiritimatiellia bacterium]|jgi:beta-glucuronidase|nr:beta-glucuronidase [Kiritimatiellia bacterium]MDP6810914.1 beta-glucuronidase [Kiritimatiellia bacterium]MDP7023368.1 beta-glucuronidase [Kiritimatiellia bacterium]
MLYPIDTPTRTRIDLSGIWRAAFDWDEKGLDEKWYENPPVGRDIAVPASWNDQFQDWAAHNFVGSVWYHREFCVPAEWDGKKNVFIRVGAAMYHATVWVNGEFLCEHEGGYLPFECEVSSALKKGAKNLLVVRVNNTLSDMTCPQGNLDPAVGGVANWRAGNFPAVHYDFFAYGGIHRPVVLHSTNKTYIDDLTVKTDIDGTRGIVRFEVGIAGGAARKVEVTIEGQTAELSVNGETTSGSITIADCVFWCPETPRLYDMCCRLYDEDGTLVDEYTLPIGVRTVKVEGKSILLNGKAVYLKGFGRHEDLPVIGKGLSTPWLVKDMGLMKWINANSFRTSHYPYCEEIMQMADRWGFMVIDESSANTLSFNVDSEATLKVHRQEIREMYQRDKNHPSVIMWSVSNESETNEEKSVPYFTTIRDDLRALDDTRPSTIVICVAQHREKTAHLFDVVCYNQYPGWYMLSGRPEKIEANVDEHIRSTWEIFGKPIIYSEFGADAISGMHADIPEMWTEEYQKDVIRIIIDALRKHDCVAGEHVWNFADFKTGQHTHRPVLNHKGVFTRDRKTKMVAHYLRDAWSDDGAHWGTPFAYGFPDERG